MSLADVREAMRNMEKLSLKEGDLVVVKCPPNSRGATNWLLGDALAEAAEQLNLKGKIVFLLVPDDFSFEVASEEDLERFGLYRVDSPLKAPS